MKTIEVEVYKWEELSQTAQQRARDWYIQGLDYEWWDCVYDMCIEDGYEKGFVIDAINFSGFYSQGDGARWIGQIDVRQWLETHAQDSIGISAWCQLIQEGFVDKSVGVKSFSSHYCHENTMDVGEVEDKSFFEDEETMESNTIFKGMTIANLYDIIATDPNCTYKTTQDINKAIEESAKDYARDIYKRLREEYEYLCSEEVMQEHFEANDYHFTNEGELA